MKNIFSSGLFWGILLIILGILFFVDNYLYFDINVFRVFVGIILLVLGLWLIKGFRGAGYHRGKNESSTIFSESDIRHIPGQQRYSVVFGSSRVDLRDLNPEKDKMIELSCVFGEMNVRMDPEANFEIISNAAFGSVKLPDNRKSSGMGSSSYDSPSLDRNQAFTTLKVDVAFSEIRITY